MKIFKVDREGEFDNTGGLNVVSFDCLIGPFDLCAVAVNFRVCRFLFSCFHNSATVSIE